MESKTLLISIVSHGQADLVERLLDDIEVCNIPDKMKLSIIITINIEEDYSALKNKQNLNLHFITNKHPLGFGKNHNNAFKKIKSNYFLVLNPDIRFHDKNVLKLIERFEKNTGIIAPKIIDQDMLVQDSCRKYPTLGKVCYRLVTKNRQPDYDTSAKNIFKVEWVAGMFMLFKSSAFRELGGFDDKYFMYLEDADICRRINNVGLEVIYDPNLTVIHNCQRDSHRKFEYFIWHIKSLLLFLRKF